ncbi:hypothetical protein [Halocynthiibacter styelae]|uniref:Uncharacterized protein n=1 Tax=Halocynthiibacter styelae TaxID=2761955 RepID=A0A8J7J3A5_9RHOB|nr:hypothetical protein [Paenihalocynthiibacter styelae]MBI1492390.1 hypothetical protein [Paenihalocynthiibacter styelae]
MTFKLILLGGIILLALLVSAEAWLKRKKKRPLSRHAINERRWDDNERGAETVHIMHSAWHDSRTGATTEKSWSISRNPHDQAKALMPGHAKQKKDQT